MKASKDYEESGQPDKAGGQEVEGEGGEQEIHVVSPNTTSALYCNSVQVNVTDDAVILQMVYVRPGTKQGVLLSEVALSPQHAIRLTQVIDTTVKRHFTRHLSLD